MQYTVEIWQQTLAIETDPQLFAPRQADAGTLAMLDKVQLRSDDRVLDLGCGCGLVGLAAAKALRPEQVVLVDIDPLAVRLARLNAEQNSCPTVRIVEGDGPAAVMPERFTLILCNPPYHTDFSVARRLIEQSWRQLEDGGRLYLVVKRLAWYQNKMASVFGGVRVWSENGYFVLASEKRTAARLAAVAAKPAAHTTRKHLKKMQKADARHPEKQQSTGKNRKKQVQ
jgi:16S rRNA (guanine1207-N2)-methyltransferase